MTEELRPTGLKAQLHHLLPRHATFSVRIHIHQLSSVPLVHGEFSARWKFKNTQKVNGNGPQDSSTSSLDDLVEEESTSARGQTAWQPLREHTVFWDHQLAVFVQMSIDRDSHQLLPHPFKLTILQRIVAGDPNAPRNPRFGAVDIDLAEYADSVPESGQSKGLVNRRYLLRGSKTNANLRLSIRVEPIGSPSPFIAPPLPNGEILAGVTSSLTTQSEVFNTRPRALDLYAPPVEEDVATVPRLTLAYGPRPTQSLIEAIFNPIPVVDSQLLSPFTRLVPQDVASSLSSSSSSFITTATTSSEEEASSQNLSPDRSRSPKWWQRNRSRSRSRSRVRQIAVSA